MDRIYYRLETDMVLFKQYAEKQGWLFKNSQDMIASTRIVDPKDNNSSIRRTLRTKDTFKVHDQFPFMDTMKWFDIDDGFLTNEEGATGNNTYFLENTEGGYDDNGDDRTYVDYYGRSIDEEDLTYCEYGGEYRTHDDAIYLDIYDEYGTEEYVENHMCFSDMEERYLSNEDCVWSEYHEDYMSSENAVEMSRDASASIDDIEDEDDYRYKDDDSILYYVDKNRNGYYFDKKDEEKYFILVDVYNPGYPTVQVYKHKKWDKNNLITKDGKLYFVSDNKLRDQLIGQKRLWEIKNSN